MNFPQAIGLDCFPVAVVSCKVEGVGLSSMSEAKLFGATLVAAPVSTNIPQASAVLEACSKLSSWAMM